MSCIPCVAEGDISSIQLEDIDRWTDSLPQLLDSRDGRRHFREYLTSRDFKESEDALEFWERCEVFLRSTTEKKSCPKQLLSSCPESTGEHSNPQSLHSKHEIRGTVKDHFIDKAEALVKLAHKKVAFDRRQMRCLHEAVASKNKEEIQTVFRKAMQSVVELLLDDYQLFVCYLLEKRGLPPNKNN